MAYKLLCLILLGWFGLIQIVWSQPMNKKSKEINNACKNIRCSCCLTNATCTNDGQCGGQCKDGYFGNKCLHDCPVNCETCKDPYNPTGESSLWGVANCTSCQPGYFSTPDYFQCQFDCNASCPTCTSATECASCKESYFLTGTTCYECGVGCLSCTSENMCTQCDIGYYNENSYCVRCSSGCHDKVCDRDSGTCSCKANYNGTKCDRCVDRMYGVEDGCQNHCQSPCANCMSVDNCTSCADGFISQGHECKHCAVGCAQCSSLDNCTECSDGYYIDDNEDKCIPCSPGCAIQNQCNSQNGRCLCTHGFAGDRCDQCAPNIQTYPACDQCIKGLYSTDCNQTCPGNCKENICDRNNGICTNGCFGNFVGVNCNSCITGWSGRNCNLNCPENCIDACNQSTGYCQICKGNFTGNTCNDCLPGLYGSDCNSTCPSTCESDICDRVSGHCTKCISGFSGDRCCLNGSSCQYCSLDSVCSECVPGTHGENCSQGCPKNCADKICDKANGTCVACANGFHGAYCTIASIGPGPVVSIAAIAGGVTSGVVATIAVVIFIFIFYRRRNKNNGPKAMARTDDLTTDRVYVNNVSIIAASKETSTYATVTNTYDTIRDKEQSASCASLNKRETRLLTTETTEAINNLDVSAKPDKPVKPEMAVKHIKAGKSSKTLSPVHRMNNKPGYESLEDEDDNDYYSSDASPEKGIPVIGLAFHVDKKDPDFFNNEYAKLPKGLVKSTDAALLDHNLSKNRYNAIYPYDETRVVLAGPGSDFINACYIEGYRKKRRYIASLGPIAKATEDFKSFWRMVWQEKTEKIVMVTNLMESGGMKCEQYWPDKNVALAYGDVKVTCHSEDVYAEYTVRSFTVRKKKEQRSLHHIHYTAWPDKGVPDDVTSLVEFRNKVKSTKTTLRGPIIVHCSAGVGRTGTYIALDILTLKGERTGFVDIFECVSKLRQQRTCMVQTAEQYEYLHRALVHTLTFESEAIPADHFMAYTASLRDDIFDRMSHFTEKISTEEMEAIDRNKAYAGYNRPGADIPGDNNRPRLYYGRTTEDNDYINALFVNSFKRRNQFILTQTPLPNTVDDFLSLVVQENCCCIVSMDAADLNDKTIGTYLPPDNQTLTTDTYEVRIKKLGSNHIFSQRTLTITSKNTSSTVTVQHFRCTNWSDNDKTPKSPSEFLTLVKQIQKVADETTQFSPIIIHCRTGSERSALPCVVLSLLQKIEIEHEVSVINTVRQVKVRRSKSIPNKEQFKFCHQCVSAYIQTFDIYSNFS